jgi:ribose transport system substrate-binding protein
MSSRRVAGAVAAALVLVGASLSACGSSSSSSQASSGGASSGGSSSSASGSTQSPAAVDQLANSIIAQATGHVQAKGPHGETAASPSTVQVTAAEIAKIQAKHATAALVIHLGGDGWSQAQVSGLESEFKTLGIKVISVTYAHGDVPTQIKNIQTVLAEKPTIMVSIPLSPDTEAAAYRAAVKQGVKLVFMDNVPAGFQAGKDYISDVSADNYGNGLVSGALLAKELHGKGQIGVVFFNVNFFVTNERFQGFKDAIAKFPGIKIVASQGVTTTPDVISNSERAANAMLTEHPNLDAIYAIWDAPAQGVLAAARAHGRGTNLIIATEDLGPEVALNIAQGGDVKDLGAQRPFDQGITEAKLAGYGLLGKKAPPYVALPALPVTKANVLQAWQTVYHSAAPGNVRSAAAG